MKNLLILGAGTAGTMTANRMARQLPKDWKVTVVDPEPTHLYQPGLLFLPFGARDEDKMTRPRKGTLGRKVNWEKTTVAAVHHDRKRVETGDGRELPYDLLVIASGSRIRPDLTEGLAGEQWRDTVHDFYTLEGATALREKLADWKGGRLVLNVVEMPIKCPVAPLEFLFLADDFFRRRGMRDDVELVYATPLDAAFTKPEAAKRLGYLLEEKGVKLETEFNTAEMGGDRLVSFDEREVPFDLLVTIPTHTGAEFVETSGIGNELSFIPTHPKTLAAKGMQDVFVLGDATDLPASKAGSVAHFQSEVLAENLMRVVEGKEIEEGFDGHANCFIETGNGKAMLIDFNYETEPLPGSFPLPGVGPFSLMKETRVNHMGKLAFRWLYWHGLLPAKPLFMPAQMSMVGKKKLETAA
ncbi:MAG: NAD(P)/FAD-dependent oxidoreductase [Nitrospira sp.]|nr:NAD(P)/FAD-dependent oxidoreductase [Nitrospira sp.]